MKRSLILLAFLMISVLSFSQKISVLTSFIINKHPQDSAAICEIRVWELDYSKVGFGLDQVPMILKKFSEKCMVNLSPGDYAIEYRTGNKLLHMENVIIPEGEPITFSKYILWRPVPFTEFDFKIISEIKVRDIIYMEF